MPTKRYLLLALVLCAVLPLVSRESRRIMAAFAAVPAKAEGSFMRDGQYPGEPFADAVNVRIWGSWVGADEKQGSLALGPFPAPRVLRFGASGYPNNPGNALFVERADTGARLPITTGPIGERWRAVEFALPASWRDQPIRLVAIDRATGLGGWLGVTEPIRGGRHEGNHALVESLASWAINGVLLGLIYFAAVRGLAARAAVPAHWIPLAAGAMVALCGYGVFWAYFASPWLGKIVTWVLLAGGALLGLTRKSAGPMPEVAATTKLVLVIGGFYLACLHLFPTPHDFYTLAANRYRENLPLDSSLPHVVADRLYHGRVVNEPLDGLRSSDLPPLQTGWQLLGWHANRLLAVHPVTASGTAAVWMQSLWILAGYGLLRSLGLTRARATAWLAVCALSGFFVQNTIFTWPKLAAGAFACGAFALWAWRRDDDEAGSNRSVIVIGGLFAALAWLADGSAAFSLLALMPWIAWRAWRDEGSPWAAAALVLGLLVLPWHLYQRFHDPSGDRLLKWHLAGEESVNEKAGAWQMIRESYRAKPWLDIWSIKAANLRTQLDGDFSGLFSVSAAGRAERKQDESFHLVRGLTWWPLLAGMALIGARRRFFSGDGQLAGLAAWVALTLAVWCLAMLKPTFLHEGSYAPVIGAFVLCSAVLARAGRGWLAIVAVLQALTFATTCAGANATIHGAPAALPFLVITAGALGWLVWSGWRSDPNAAPATLPPVDAGAARGRGKLAAWWQNPQLNLWVLLALAVLLFLRKPHALHTPQLWAEDGSIFLMQNDAHGSAAWFLTYMGYLHLLPRLIAFAASHLFDPAWWPAFYNGVSFVLTVAILARLFSPRLDLPGKPWLALAFFLGPNTGEILFNITNLQWLTAFVLVQQVLIAPPTSQLQRGGDLLLVALAGLTGPFVIVLAPLFAWRWWCNRNRDTLALLIVAAGCAAVQAWFVVQTGPKFDYQAAPLHALDALNVIARRLLAWPLLGETLAREIPPRAIGIAGGLFLVALLGWSLRPHPRRPLRGVVVAAFALVLLAGMYRTRPDTWADDNLFFADRYFYIPRVLLAWLLIWEFDAVPRGVAVVARLTCVLAVVVHLRDYQLRAPVDYHWAQHIEPIRRGVPAEIPTLPEGWRFEYRGRPGSR